MGLMIYSWDFVKKYYSVQRLSEKETHPYHTFEVDYKRCLIMFQTAQLELWTDDEAYLFFEADNCKYSLWWMRHFLPKVMFM